MRSRAALTCVGIVTMLGACQESTPADNAQSVSPEAVSNKKSLEGWARAFSSPSEVIDTFNVEEFGNSQFHAANLPPPAYISTGTLVELAGSSALPNNAGVYVYGNSETSFDEIRIKLNLNEPDTATAAKTKFQEIVSGTFKKLNVSGAEKIAESLKSEKPSKSKIDGADFEVRTSKMTTPGARSILFIFSRPGVELQD